MAFGNERGESGAVAGVTRNPATRERVLYFDFQFNGQGEDVVARRHKPSDNFRLPLGLPVIWTRRNAMCRELEALFVDAQDVD